MTDLANYYQFPEILPPIDTDAGNGGISSDHLTVVMAPIATVDNKLARISKTIIVRSIHSFE